MATEKKKADAAVIKHTPAMEGSVSRSVDFNLKKEDLMTLILEGRKEVMEEEISKLSKLRALLTDKFDQQVNLFRDAVIKSLEKAVNKDAKNLAKQYGTGEDANVTVSLVQREEHINFMIESLQSVKNEWGEKVGTQANIRSQTLNTIKLPIFISASFNVHLSFGGHIFVQAHDLFKREPLGCSSTGNSSSFTLARQDLNIDKQREMPEYKLMKETAEKLKETIVAFAQLTADYALFTSNKERSKAAMIKEVLSRDEAGQALLDNIVAASKGVKLLS